VVLWTPPVTNKVLRRRSAVFLINPADVERETLAQGTPRSALEVPPLVFLTFNKSVVDELTVLSGLKEWEWPAARFTPAFSPSFKGWRGQIAGREIAAFVPHMGPSTLASFCEELIHYGARVIFLLCASWGLGREYLEEGEIHLPSFALGIDGTSPHYGITGDRVEAEPLALEALAAALDEFGATWKEGGVGTCEAFYRITPDLADRFREQGCLSMENGETAALFALARAHGIPAGVLLQPYFDLQEGWNPSYTGEKYRESGRLQVRAAVEASNALLPSDR
jgi:uridine phosphorylase